ncbi:MAG: hypothetical protein LBU32_13760 [Clostridiales bacterium]|jgi:hypothetical protein|nr:hypothetical protein [Clostridiales bacterium]
MWIESILVSFAIGYIIIKELFWDSAGEGLKTAGYMVMLPASYIAGTLVFNWLIYISALAFAKTGSPMLWGNLASHAVSLAFAAYYFSKKRPKMKHLFIGSRIEAIYTVSAAVLWTLIFFMTLYSKSGVLKISSLIFGDASVHLAIMESFSKGSNFPTQYPLFADGSMNYHFMFFFMAGNLEYLGAPQAMAYNIPSILSGTSLSMLIFAFATMISGRKAVGALAGALLFFRSSFSAFIFAFQNGLVALFSQEGWIGFTDRESWGIYTINVFINQRHLAFAIALAFLCAIFFFKFLLESYSRPSQKRFFSLQAWKLQDPRLAVSSGAILGLSAFWNGSSVLAALPILFVMALFSQNKLGYLVFAAISSALAYAQTFFFSRGSMVENISYKFGYLASEPTLFGIAKYYFLTFGILGVIVIVAAFLLKKELKVLILAFCAPMALITFAQLSVQLFNNHKNANAAVAFLNIISAWAVCELISPEAKKASKKRKAESKSRLYLPARRILAVFICFILTVSGIVDWTHFARFTATTSGRRFWSVEEVDQLSLWIAGNTEKDSLFLVPPGNLYSSVSKAGRPLFLYYDYVPMSMGYSVSSRSEARSRIYEGVDGAEIARIAKESKIDYILVNESLSINADMSAFEVAFESQRPFQRVYRVPE